MTIRGKTVAALAVSFVCGGAAVGAFALSSGVAHGVVTTTSKAVPGKGQSDAMYTARNAWAQTVAVSASTTLSIPPGDRLTITAALGNPSCTLTGSLNGSVYTYDLQAILDGQGTWLFLPFSVDTGSIVCTGGSTSVYLDGYLTPQTSLVALGLPTKGLSSSEYTAENAWAQSIAVGSGTTTLSIPSADRLTITASIGGLDCTVTGSVNGSTVSNPIDSNLDSGAYESFLPFSVDSGASIACPSGSSGSTLVGYLTPLPAG
jgi:hypothetical protein